MKFEVNGTEYEIETTYHHKQCDQYHKALKEGDSVKAHWLHIPPTHKPYYMIEHEMTMIMLEYIPC